MFSFGIFHSYIFRDIQNTASQTHIEKTIQKKNKIMNNENKCNKWMTRESANLLLHGMARDLFCE